MHLYRLCRSPFRALDGEGARLYGGRWNSPGRPAVYASSTLALSALEYLVHVDPPHVPADLVAITIAVPDDLAVDTLDAASLPADWAQTVGSPECQAAGDAWLIAGATPLFRVPAAPIPEEHNFLLNPRHAMAGRWRTIAERPFTYDPRLLL